MTSTSAQHHDHKQQETYYEILELRQDATPLDVKKSYRRLALQYHPDRNGGSIESTERFQLIGEAYETLSDARRRREYDQSLTEAGSWNGSDGVGQYHGSYATGSHHRRRYYRPSHPFADPFRQFDDLFGNDPFFQEAFGDMDDEFSRRFKTPAGSTAPKTAGPMKKGWGAWILDCLGVQLTMTTVTHGPDGSVSATSYSSQPRREGGEGEGYTDRRTKSYIQNDGRRVTIRFLEKDGNRIEDKYVEGTLVERKVNGVVENVERIGG